MSFNSSIQESGHQPLTSMLSNTTGYARSERHVTTSNWGEKLNTPAPIIWHSSHPLSSSFSHMHSHPHTFSLWLQTNDAFWDAFNFRSGLQCGKRKGMEKRGWMWWSVKIPTVIRQRGCHLLSKRDSREYSCCRAGRLVALVCWEWVWKKRSISRSSAILVPSRCGVILVHRCVVYIVSQTVTLFHFQCLCKQIKSLHINFTINLSYYKSIFARCTEGPCVHRDAAINFHMHIDGIMHKCDINASAKES